MSFSTAIKLIYCSFHILKQKLIAPFSEPKKGKAVTLHATEALEEKGGIAPTHSRPRN
jgi:hypothetical protein